MSKKIKTIDIKDINNPNYVKELTNKELTVLSEQIRQYIIESIAKNGGHLSSNLGCVESIISLCKNFDFDKDKILFDVGHQAYTYKILTGRSLNNLRQKDGISGFQKLSESKYDVFEAGHSSTSISAANGMAIARDLNNDNYEIIAYIGDASIVNGLAFEGLNNISQGKHKVIIVLNDNNMSISRSIGGMGRFLKKISNKASYINTKEKYKRVLLKTRLGNKIYNASFRIKNGVKQFLVPVTVFDNMGFKYIGPINGHDFKSMDRAFKKAKKAKNSVIVHLRTIKGKGYKFSEQDVDGNWHGVDPFDIKTGKTLLKKENISWSKHYANLLEEIMSENKNVILITPAMIHGSCLENIFKEYKDRSFDVGIAEEHAFTMASGLSLNKFHPIISIYSTFLQRGYDEMLHDIVRMNLNATLLIDRCGLSGHDGETHQGIFDEGLIYALPNTVIAMASNSYQAESLIKESLKNHGLFAIRLPKGQICALEKTDSIKFGEWVKLIDENNETCIVSVGPNTTRLCKLIKESGLKIDLYDAVYQKPFLDIYIDDLKKYKKVLIYQSYATKHGFAYNLLEKLVSSNMSTEIILKCLPDEFISQGDINEQLKDLKLTPEDIINALK